MKPPTTAMLPEASGPNDDVGVSGDVAISPRPDGFLDRVRRAPGVCRQLFGIPDYERYLAHAAAKHPGAPVLSRRAYFALAIERRYGRSGPRCC
jgi:uncharacterized short protein YbdD (DUF466 family)